MEVEDDGRGMSTGILIDTAVEARPTEARGGRGADQPRFSISCSCQASRPSEDGDRPLGARRRDGCREDKHRKLGGVVDITSGWGSAEITITLPITLAIISVLGVEVVGRSSPSPSRASRRRSRSTRASYATRSGAKCPDPARARPFQSAGSRDSSASRTRPAHARGAASSDDQAVVVIASVGNRRLGFVVDRLVGQQDIVIKALGKSLKSVRGFAGATELGDQRVGLVLDVAALMEEFMASEKERFAVPEGALAT